MEYHFKWVSNKKPKSLKPLAAKCEGSGEKEKRGKMDRRSEKIRKGKRKEHRRKAKCKEKRGAGKKHQKEKGKEGRERRRGKRGDFYAHSWENVIFRFTGVSRFPMFLDQN